VHAHAASGGTIAAAIAHHMGSVREQQFLRCSFSLNCLFKCPPEEYVQPLPGWEKTVSLVGHRLTVENTEIQHASFTLKRKRADSEHAADGDVEDISNQSKPA
jgi:hypothetical protein